MQFGLHALHLRGAEPFEIVDAINARAGVDLLDPGDFLFAGRDDQFAEPSMRYAVLLAIRVEPLAPLDAAGRRQAPLRAIEPAVDYLAVARGSLKSDRES